MLIQIGLGLVMTAITICCGALAIVVAAAPLRRYRAQLIDQGRFTSQLIVLTLVSTWLVLGMLVLMLCWGSLLQFLGVFPDIQTSLYFAMISFTTVGYGDVVPPPNWRILAGFISVDGFLLFGLNTAFVFEILRRMRGDQSAHHVGE